MTLVDQFPNRFSAMIAPLGVKSGDGRVLHPHGSWVLRTQSPVMHPDVAGGDPVGYVDRLWVDGDKLMCAGGVNETGQFAIRSGDWRPEFQLIDPNGRIERTAMVFTGATLNALVLGQTPAWPDVWIRMDPAAVVV